MLRTGKTVWFYRCGKIRASYCWHCGKSGSAVVYIDGRCADCMSLETHESVLPFCSGCGAICEKPITLRAPPNSVQFFYCAECIAYEADKRASTDAVNHPPHYTGHPSGVECVMVAEHFGFNLWNALKYIWRADAKGAPIEDLRKAVWYINREIKKRTKGGAT
jgi:hypothetical protein